MAGRDLVFNFTGDPTGLAQATETVKARLQELLEAETQQARATTQLYEEMTRAQQEEFRKRFDSEDDFQNRVEDLRRARQSAEQNALDEYTRRSREAFSDVSQAAGDSAKDVADSTEQGFARAEDAAGDLSGTVKDELTGAFREWDGTAEGAVQSVASGLQGLAGIIPGIGGLIGAGLGVVIAQWGQSWRETAQENESRVRSMYDDMLASGEAFLSEQFVQNKIADIVNDAQQLAEVEQLARDAGLAIDDVLAARAGSAPALELVLGRVNDKLADAVDLQRDGTFESQDQLIAVENTVLRLQNVRDILTGVVDEQGGVVDKVELTNSALDATRGNLLANQEEIRVQNRLLAQTPTDIKIGVDFSEADRAIQRWAARRRTLSVQLGLEQGGRIIR